ncbi:MAG: TIM-barrel domain-containing protein, partial [bacterium]
NLAWLNQYYYKHTGRNGLRGQSFSRWAGWGDHRHPIHFSGDADTGWAMLAFEVPFTSTAGNIGCFFWSHDIGGHMGMRNPESYTRWVQFGATSAALRSHSTRMPDQDRRPWKYPNWAEDSMRIAFHLRSEIFPYIYSSVRQSHMETIPLNRPMYIMHPENEKAYRNPQQYYFGDHMLAAPIVSPGVGKNRVGTQVVWLPPTGDTWYNWFTGEKFSDGEYIVAADIDEFPLYVRGGVPIPIQPYTQRMATEPLDELILRCYPNNGPETGEFILHEDDGVSMGYKKGEFAETKLTCERQNDSTVIKIGPAQGTYNSQLKERSYIIELPCTMKAESAEIDGKPVEAKYDEREHVNRVRIPATPVAEGVEVKVRVEPEDPAILKAKAESRRIKGVVEDAAEGETLRDVIERLHKKGAEKKILDTLLAVGGTALYRKDESLYLYKSEKSVYFHAAPGLMDGDTFKFLIEDRYGDKDTVVLSEDRKASEIPIAVAASNLPRMPETPGFGVRANRVAIVEFSIKGNPFTFEEITDSKKSWLRKWSVAGPFDFDRGTNISQQIYGPETGEILPSAVYQGYRGQNVAWRKAKPYENNVIDLQKHYYIEQDNTLAYAVTYLHSEQRQEVTFRVNSDDGAELWLNGEKLLSKSKPRSINQETDSVTGTLKPGANEVLLKVCQYNYDWGFKVSVETNYPIEESFKKK